MSTRAKYLGAVGTVIDGRLRDLQEHRSLDYPVLPFSGNETSSNQADMSEKRSLLAMSEPQLRKK